ncbi:MAG: DNA polymerase III subunit gamma/tau [Phycisphaerae bacterium]|nr:DNA polymerase III subunit gamma/tau [Phycisphaerae bacterium]
MARKYRSQTFDDVVGQDASAKTLKNAIKTGRIAHAYLFCGTRGVGKTTIARILAKALNCLAADGPTITPCCQCDSCVAINTGEDIDVLEIDGASNNGVDQVRELRDNAIYRPARARYKIYIIDEVHMLTVAAFNALLKILEEPPAHVKFIFATTEPNKVLATIQSRCQRYDFRNISVGAIADHLKVLLNLEQITFEDDLVLSVAKMANGSMRDGLSLLDRLISTGVTPLSVNLLEEFLGQPNIERIYDLIQVMSQQDAAQALIQVDALIRNGLSEAQIVDALIDALRDLMIICTAGMQPDLVVLTEQQKQKAEHLARQFDAAALIYMVTALEKLRWTVKNSDTPRTLLEAAILRFTLNDHFINIDTLLARLNTGQAPGAGAPKKKHPLAASTPIPHRQTVTPTSRPAAQNRIEETPPGPSDQASPTSQGDIQTLKAQWEEVLIGLADSLGPGTVSLLMKARPTQWDNGNLTLQFDPSAKVQKGMCESSGRADTIKNALQDCLGARFNLTFTLQDTGAPDAPEQPAQATAAEIRQKRNDLLNDPGVKTVLVGLNATVTNIEEKKERE